jgi:hypothetical protein
MLLKTENISRYLAHADIKNILGAGELCVRPNALHFAKPGNVRRKFMTYQHKKEPLNNDEVNKLTNACSIFREKFAI